MSVIREWLSGAVSKVFLVVSITLGASVGAVLSTPVVLGLGDKEATARYAITVDIDDQTLPSAIVEGAATQRGFATLDYVRSQEFLLELADATQGELSLLDVQEQVVSSYTSGSLLTLTYVAPNAETLDVLIDRANELIIERGQEELEPSSGLASTRVGFLSLSRPLDPLLSWPALLRNSVIGAVLGGTVAFGWFGVRHLRNPLISRQSDLEAVVHVPLLGSLSSGEGYFLANLRSLTEAMGPVVVVHDSPHAEDTLGRLCAALDSPSPNLSRSLIVDACPRFAVDGAAASKGLADVLLGVAGLAEVVEPHGTSVDLVRWGSGSVRETAFDVAVRNFLHEVRGSYSAIVIVTPPLDGSRGILPHVIRGNVNLLTIVPGLENKVYVANIEGRLRGDRVPLDAIVLGESATSIAVSMLDRFPSLQRSLNTRPATITK